MSRMNEMWKVVLSLSLSGTVMIISIFLLCRVFREKFSRRWQYSIWLVAVARLLVPFSMEINVTGSALAELERHAGLAAGGFRSRAGRVGLAGIRGSGCISTDGEKV